MSKPQQDAEAKSAELQVPGRTLGLTLMCIMIVFVAVWMAVQSGQQDARNTLSTSMGQDALAGFNNDAWFLPDDPLLGFVKIPAGSFSMGSNPTIDRLAYENERWSISRRQGSVELDDYYIAKYEITVAQFRAFVAERPDDANGVDVDSDGALPVTNITLPEALAYARWLQQKLENSADTPSELRNYIASGGQVSIPSEAEWEKAARGADGRIFLGNSPSTDFANYGSSAALPVGSRLCSECSFGLQDMSGNVWELTRSPLEDYPYDPSDDAENLSEDALWVMRGGSFSDSVGNVRAAVRGGVDPSVRNDTIGFRIVFSKL